MSKPQVTEHNSETDEVIIRDMTDAEYQAYLDNQTAIEAHAEKVKTDEIAKVALLKKLGITADEAALLLA